MRQPNYQRPLAYLGRVRFATTILAMALCVAAAGAENTTYSAEIELRESAVSAIELRMHPSSHDANLVMK